MENSTNETDNNEYYTQGEGPFGADDAQGGYQQSCSQANSGYTPYTGFDSDSFNTTEPTQEPPRRRRGSGVGTAIAIIIIAAIMLVLLASAIFISKRPALPSYPTMTLQPTITMTPDADATPTPVPTSRPYPLFDGVAPQIGDSGLEALPDIVAAVSPGVISVLNYGPMTTVGQYTRENLQGTGSGFIVSSEGYVLTNAHVIDGASSVKVQLYNSIEYEAEVIGSDISMDVAVLRIEAEGLTVLKLGSSSEARVGEFVLAIGDPTGTALAGTPTFGIIGALNRSVNIDGRTNNYIQTDAAINPGNSGGPLINMRGEVIGVTSAKTVTASYDENGNAISAEGLGFALPIDDVLSVVVQLVTEGKVQRPGIGLTSIYLDEATAQQYQRPSGILIVSVLADAPACNAGIRADDILVECNGIKLTGNDMFGEIVRSFKIGDSMPVKYWRNGKYLTTNIIIGDLNQMGDTIYNNETGGDWLE